MLIDTKDFEMELSLYMNRLHDDCGGCCSVDSDEKVLSQTDVLNILKQTKEYTKDHTKNNFHDGSVLVDKETIDKMYDRYIGRCVALGREIYASYNEGFVSGQKSEDEQWLKLFGIDLSYEKVHRDTCKAVCSDHINEVLEEIVSKSDDPIEKEAAAAELEKRGVRKGEDTSSCEDDDEPTFTQKQEARIDEVENAAFEFIKVLLEDQNTDWNMQYIGEVADAACDVLTSMGFKVRYPAICDNKICEYYGGA